MDCHSIVNWKTGEHHLHLPSEYPKTNQELFYIPSSGTTSKHNYVGHSIEGFLESAKTVNSFLGLDQNDQWAVMLPDTSVATLAIHARAYLSAAKISNLNSDTSVVSMVPTQLYDLCQKPDVLPSQSLRYVLVGGAHLRPELYFRARKIGWPVLPTFGSTELASSIAIASPESLKNPQEYPRLQILEHIEVRSDDHDQLSFRSKSLFQHSVRKVSPSEFEIQEPKPGEFWQSQDFGNVTENHIEVYGRKQDFAIRNGWNINLHLLEQRVAEQFQIDNFCLLALDDERQGAKIVLVHEDLLEANAILNWKPQEGRIDQVLKVDKLPRNSMGKILKKQLIETLS